MSTIGENIQQIRKALGWTQEDLAKRMGYKSKSTINKIELGINDIPQNKIVKFAEVLGTTPANLMGWDDPSDVNLQLFASSPEEIKLNEGEQMLLELFRKIPEDQQGLVLNLIRAALGNPEQ
jgi:transcriptional regulator with XRE-family HTH domain